MNSLLFLSRNRTVKYISLIGLMFPEWKLEGFFLLYWLQMYTYETRKLKFFFDLQLHKFELND